jgi:DNA polymerase III subunit gamma/tau
MENFLVSARKYRPDTFDTVVGQSVITSTLKSAILSGHLAHAYLFCGPRGVGKTTCARIFAKTINCTSLGSDGEPCNQCESCRSFNGSKSFNIHELDAASNNSVDDIRNLIESVRIIPQSGKYSVYIIDEVHMLSQQAFNAFLKTLEEPPAHAVFILATTEKHKIIPTILSRCQIYDFSRIKVDDIVTYLKKIALKEEVTAAGEALGIIALKADGAMRDALTIFDQLVSFSQNEITYQSVIENLNVLDYEYYFSLTDSFLQQDVSKALMILNEILSKGFDGLNFISGLASHIRDVMVCRDPVTSQLLETGESVRAKYVDQAKHCETDFLYKALEILNQCEIYFKASRNQRLHMEITLIRLCNITPEKKNTGKGPAEELKMSVNSLLAEKSNTNTAATAGNAPNDNAGVRESTSKTYREKAEDQGRMPKSHTVSIKDALQNLDNGNKDTTNGNSDAGLPEDTVADPETETPIVHEFLMKCWLAYADSIKNEKPRFSAALKVTQPFIKDKYALEISFSNQAQLDAFHKQVKGGLEQFLRRELQQPAITVEATIQPTDEHNKKLYTAEEKLAYLEEKNPLVNKFIQDLGLELE